MHKTGGKGLDGSFAVFAVSPLLLNFNFMSRNSFIGVVLLGQNVFAHLVQACE